MKAHRTLALLIALFALFTSARNDGDADPYRPPAAPRPEPVAADFRVLSFSAAWSARGLDCDESSASTFSFQSPRIRVEAAVDCGQGHPGWEIGLIQALVANASEMAYADGSTAWVQPVLPVSDSDGPNSPFYGASAHDAAAGEVALSYGDAPSTTMTWAMPLPPDGKKKERKDSLRSIARKQDFVVWLVAFERADRKVIYLKELLWKLDVKIELDCAKKRGSRVKSARIDKAEPLVRDPTIAPAGYPNWLDGPIANEAQRFLLYSEGQGGKTETFVLY